jgi:hypothetical protein
LSNPLLPIGHAFDFSLVEKDVQLMTPHFFKLGEILIDELNEISNSRLRFVLVRIEDGQVV